MAQVWHLVLLDDANKSSSSQILRLGPLHTGEQTTNATHHQVHAHSRQSLRFDNCFLLPPMVQLLGPHHLRFAAILFLHILRLSEILQDDDHLLREESNQYLKSLKWATGLGQHHQSKNSGCCCTWEKLMISIVQDALYLNRTGYSLM